MSRFFSYKYIDLDPYTPGEQPKERRYIKLNTNESPFPPSRRARELAANEAERLELYPDPDCKELTSLMARELGVDSSKVMMTNGSDEALNFAFMAYCDEKTPAIFADITYGFYKVFARVNSLPYRVIPLCEDFSICVEDYLGVGGTIFIANPNAPTGLALGLSDIERILASNPNNILVVDEAYVDFGTDSAVTLINKYDNLLVTGTFSKSRSMAGARLGYAVASEAIINDLSRIRYSTNPYNVNRMTAAAGIGALLDREYFEKNCKHIIKWRKWLSDELSSIGFELTDSVSNFIFARHKDIGGEELYKALKARGILVRHFDKPRISEYIRVTVGSGEDMRTLVRTIKEIMEI